MSKPVFTTVVTNASATLASRCQQFRVPDDYAVYIRPFPTNAGTLNIGADMAAALRGDDFVNKTDLEREWPIEDLGRIFIAGAGVGDKLSISVRLRDTARRALDNSIVLSRPDRPVRV
jgi:hypothetical protein